MSPSSPPYYHGSSADNIESIVETGIDLGKTQSRDRGFFGDGFYVTASKDIAMNHATTVGPNSPAIVEIDIASAAKILHAGETFSSGSVIPSRPPSWHEEFLAWSLGKVESAAVWEFAEGKSKEDIMESARASRTPGSGEFDRQRWYQEVTEFAEVQGYDLVYWSDSEIIIKNPSVVTNYKRVR